MCDACDILLAAHIEMFDNAILTRNYNDIENLSYCFIYLL